MNITPEAENAALAEIKDDHDSMPGQYGGHFQQLLDHADQEYNDLMRRWKGDLTAHKELFEASIAYIESCCRVVYWSQWPKHPNKLTSDNACKCQGFYRPPDCPVHGVRFQGWL